MGLSLHETGYGKNFFEKQLPSLITALNRIADNQEKNLAENVRAATDMKGCNVAKRIIYLCYEENSTALYSDAGNINRVFVTDKQEEALEWADLSRKYAKDNDYLPVSSEDEEVFESDMSIGTAASLWVYKSGDEASKRNYGICVDCFDLSHPQDLKLLFD